MLQLSSLCDLCLDFVFAADQSLWSTDSVMLHVGFVSCGQWYGSYSQRLHEVCMKYLAVDLPRQLNLFTVAAVDMDCRQQLVNVFSLLPFDWLKSIIEERYVLHYISYIILVSKRYRIFIIYRRYMFVYSILCLMHFPC
jgi:hypothetical protein